MSQYIWLNIPKKFICIKRLPKKTFQRFNSNQPFQINLSKKAFKRYLEIYADITRNHELNLISDTF